jgi:phage shock protein PspC (stress-responsive transcriptional regulator)
MLHTMSDETTTQTPAPEPRRLRRTSGDRVLGGVCGGLGAYLGVDPVVVRVAAVVLALFGGAGVLFYLAAWLLVPSDDPTDGHAPGRAATIAGVVVLVVGLGTLLPFRFNGGWGFGAGGFFLSVVLVGLAGLVVWRVASGERATGTGAQVVRRAGLGLAILAASLVLAVGGAWAAAAGGATVVAIIVIAAGATLVASAFVGGARWLIVPAVALALPAGAVAATNLDVKGGVGDRTYRPASINDLRDHYRVGVGRLVIDLRDSRLTPGDHHLRVEGGVGQVLVLVPPQLCVSSKAHVGVGAAQVFQRDNGGLDVDWSDARNAPRGTPRLIVDGDLGVGDFQIGENERGSDGQGPFKSDLADVGTNSACGIR